MVRIRLRRVGRKKQPSYRVVVADSRSPRDGRYIEKIGFYNPRTQPSTMTLQEDRALYWLSVGAQPSEAVQRIMNTLGTTARFERMNQGEDLAVLVAEAEAEAEAREPISPKTRYPAKSKAEKAAEKAARIPSVEVDGAEEIADDAADAITDLEDAIVDTADAVEEAVADEAEEITDAAEEAVSDLEDAVVDTADAVEEAVADEAEEITDAAEEAVSDLEDAVVDTADAVEEAVTDDNENTEK